MEEHPNHPVGGPDGQSADNSGFAPDQQGVSATSPNPLGNVPGSADDADAWETATTTNPVADVTRTNLPSWEEQAAAHGETKEDKDRFGSGLLVGAVVGAVLAALLVALLMRTNDDGDDQQVTGEESALVDEEGATDATSDQVVTDEDNPFDESEADESQSDRSQTDDIDRSGGGTGRGDDAGDSEGNGSGTTDDGAADELLGADLSNAELIDRYEDSLVEVRTEGAFLDGVVNDLAEAFPDAAEWVEENFPDLAEKIRGGIGSSASGTGVVVSEDGLVVTAAHLVQGADDVQIVDADGSERYASVVRREDGEPVALLSVDGESSAARLSAATEPPSAGDELVILRRDGDEVVAVPTMVLRSNDERPRGLIPLDVAIPDGTSGAPLVDRQGRLVGITVSLAGQDAGIGFAIPVDSVLASVTSPATGDSSDNPVELPRGQSEDDGDLEVPLVPERPQAATGRPVLGVEVTELSAELGDEAGLDGGVVVSNVLPGSGAEDAGFEVGDVIVRLDGKKVVSTEALVSAISRYEPGEEVDVTVWRDGDTDTVAVELGSRSA